MGMQGFRSQGHPQIGKKEERKKSKLIGDNPFCLQHQGQQVQFNQMGSWNNIRLIKSNSSKVKKCLVQGFMANASMYAWRKGFEDGKTFGNKEAVDGIIEGLQDIFAMKHTFAQKNQNLYHGKNDMFSVSVLANSQT